MPQTPAITGRVRITVLDINGNSVAKQFDAVSGLYFDYVKGMVSVIDVTGQFYFTLLTITTLTYTVVGGVAPITTVVMS